MTDKQAANKKWVLHVFHKSLLKSILSKDCLQNVILFLVFAIAFLKAIQL